MPKKAERARSTGDEQLSAKYQSAAVLTIKGARRMTVKGRKQIAAWLRHHAEDLERGGSRYAERFRGRYMYSIGRHGFDQAIQS